MLSFEELTTKFKNLSVICVVGGLIFGIILGTLIIGTLFTYNPTILMSVFVGLGAYIMWAICIVIAVLLTCLITHEIKKLNTQIKEFKDGNNL